MPPSSRWKSSKWFGILFSIGVLAIGIGLIEWYCRNYVVTNSPLLKVDYRSTPSLRLQASQGWSPNSSLGVKPSSIELGKRSKRIAFIGDSVTFCVGLPNGDCFPEWIHSHQDAYDVYNFGVPGYGILHVKQALNEITSKEHFDAVVYVYNSNDVYDAMPVLLTLADSASSRFASIYDYRGSLVSKTKQFFIDYFKLPLVLHYFWANSSFSKPKPSPVSSLPVTETETAAIDCYQSRQELLENSWATKNTLQTVKKMYEDPKLGMKLQSELLEMKALATSRGSKFIVVPFLDFAYLEEKNLKTQGELLSILRTSGDSFLDSREYFNARKKECGIYQNDLAHFDSAGSRLFGDWLWKNLGLPLNRGKI